MKSLSTELEGRTSETSRVAPVDFFGAVICMAVGLVLAVLPHVCMRFTVGTWHYLASGDDAIYLAIARVPYNGEDKLRDPYAPACDQLPSAYAWLQFVPVAKLARWAALTPMSIALLWRLLGGPLLGLSLFVLFRQLFKFTRAPAMWALGASLFCLSDAGFIVGRIGIQDLHLLHQMCTGNLRSTFAEGLPQYRVVTPLLNLPVLLLLAAVFASECRSLLLLCAGAILLGVCILLYFYFWTAAVLALSLFLCWRVCLLLGTPTQRRQNLREVWFTAAVMAGGLVIGAYQIYSNSRIFADPKYQEPRERMAKPYHVPARDPVRVQYLRNAWAWAELSFGALSILLFHVRRIGIIWAMALAGFALKNSAVVTGLEFENFHWTYVHASFGEILILCCTCQLLDRWLTTRWVRVLWSIPLLLLTVALAWRPFEARRAPEPVELIRTLADLEDLREPLGALGEDDVLAGPHACSIAVLFSRCAKLFHGGWITDQEIHERHALNAWLNGLDCTQYAQAAVESGSFSLVVSDKPEWQPDAIRELRLKAFRDLEADSSKLMAKYRPTALLLSNDSRPPVRGGPWTLYARGLKWSLWRKHVGS